MSDPHALSVPVLSGIRVVDICHGLSGRYCARLFADFGARVERFELGAVEDYSVATAVELAVYLARHLDTGKELQEPPSRWGIDRAVRDALGGADLIICDQVHAPLIEGEVDGLQPVIVLTRDFGDGERAEWKGCELIHQALGGAMYTTGRPGLKPIYGLGRRAYYAAGVTAYVSALAALIERGATGKGQTVEVSTEDAVLAMSQNLVAQYSYSRAFPSRSAYPGMLAQVRCRDGWLVLFALRGWRDLCDVFGLVDLKDDERFRSPAALRRNWPEALTSIEIAARDRICDELVAALQARKISCAKAIDVPALFTTQHYIKRGILPQTPVLGSTGGGLGPVFRVHHDTARRQMAGFGQSQAFGGAAEREDGADNRPLAGVRVLDLTTAWAGPFASRALAFLGAQVIKVENAIRLDSWRGPVSGMGDPSVYPDREGGEDPFNRHSWFNTQNHDKLSIALNLKNPAGRSLAHRLCDRCDVLVANFSPNVLKGLGLGYDVLKQSNPALVYVEMPAFGNAGPWASHVGMGKTMEAASGMSRLMGYGDAEPLLTGPALFDPIGGLHGAAAVLTALAGRQRGRGGRYVEVAQVEAALHWIGEFVLASADGRVLAEPQGNSVTFAEPHDAFPCAGDDEWVAIAVFDDAQWRTLSAMTADQELLSPRFDTRDARRAARDTIGSLLARWTRRHDKNELSLKLQRAGVPAAPVRNGRDIHDDAALRRRNMIVEIEHEAVGLRSYSGLAYKLSRTPGRITAPAPRFGEHTRKVLSTILGLSDAEIDAAIADGAAHVEPVMGGRA